MNNKKGIIFIGAIILAIIGLSNISFSEEYIMCDNPHTFSVGSTCNHVSNRGTGYNVQLTSTMDDGHVVMMVNGMVYTRTQGTSIIMDDVIMYLENVNIGSEPVVVMSFSNIFEDLVCADDDDGFDLYKAGTASMNNGVSNTDTCVDNNNVLEYYCGYSSGRAAIYSYTGYCRNGCLNGECIMFECENPQMLDAGEMCRYTNENQIYDIKYLAWTADGKVIVKINGYTYLKSENSSITDGYFEIKIKDITDDDTPKVTIEFNDLRLLPPCGNYGDVDFDGFVTDVDQSMIQNFVAGNIEFDAEQIDRADVNANGRVDVGDAANVLYYVEGNADTFGVCENISDDRLSPCGTFGDVTNDGFVNSDDAAYLYDNMDGFEIDWRGDVNGNGRIDFNDVVLISDYAEGNIDTFPVCNNSEIIETEGPEINNLRLENGYYVFDTFFIYDEFFIDGQPVSANESYMGGAVHTEYHIACMDGDVLEVGYTYPDGSKREYARADISGFSCEQETCMDSDIGTDYYIKGQVVFEGITYHDSCYPGDDGWYLNEGYCFSDEDGDMQYGSVQYKCPGWCYDGECIEPDEPELKECDKEQILFLGEACIYTSNTKNTYTVNFTSWDGNGTSTSALISINGEQFLKKSDENITFDEININVWGIVDGDNPTIALVFEEKIADVEFFIMSTCNESQKAIDEIIPVLEHFGDSAEFRMNFIGATDDTGINNSFRSDDEITSDMIEMCIMHKRPERYLDIIECVNDDADNIQDNWEACVDMFGADTQEIYDCYTGELGQSMLSESYLYSFWMDVNVSPTILFKGIEYNGSIDSVYFHEKICEQIPNDPKCDEMPDYNVEIGGGESGPGGSSGSDNKKSDESKSDSRKRRRSSGGGSGYIYIPPTNGTNSTNSETSTEQEKGQLADGQPSSGSGTRGHSINATPSIPEGESESGSGTGPSAPSCSGCINGNGICMSYGIRTEDQYCDYDGVFRAQKQEKEICYNNYECSSNVCVNQKCVSTSLIERIIRWFENLFG